MLHLLTKVVRHKDTRADPLQGYRKLLICTKLERQAIVMKKLIGMLLAIMLICSATVITTYGADNDEPDMITGTCGENINWEMNRKTGVLSIDGTGTLNEIQYSNGDILLNDFYRQQIKTVIVGEGITVIDKEVFRHYDNMTEIKLPSTLKEIGDFAFENCGLLSVHLNEGLKKLGKDVFLGCPLEEIELPVSLEAVDVGFSNGLPGKLSVRNGNEFFTVHDNVLFNKTKTRLIYYGDSKRTEYVVPKTVKVMGENSLRNGKLKTLVLPDSLQTIKDGAIANCRNLTKVIMGKSLHSIGPEAFYQCSSLKYISFPSTLKEIGDSAFVNCGLLSVRLNEGLKKLDREAFSTCRFLERIELPSSLQVIGVGALGLVDRISLKSGNKFFTVQDNVLFNKAKTKLIYYAYSNKSTKYVVPKTVRVIGEDAITNDNLKTLVLPDSLRTIDNGAISICDNLTNVVMGKNLQSIGSAAFFGCGSLKNISLPNSLKTIKKKAFFNSGLRKLTIPGSVKTVDSWIVADCRYLTQIELKSGVERIERNAFNKCKNLQKLTIPKTVSYIYPERLGDFSSSETDQNPKIYGVKGSYAEKYTKKYNYKFVRL